MIAMLILWMAGCKQFQAWHNVSIREPGQLVLSQGMDGQICSLLRRNSALSEGSVCMGDYCCRNHL